MCSTTGSGMAKKRALAAVTSAPIASWLSLAVPAIAGCLSDEARRDAVADGVLNETVAGGFFV